MLFLLLALLITAQCDDMQRPVNILLLMNDQHRFDVLGSVNPAALTPNLDALAADGMRFDKGYSSTPTCTPARAALLTGLGPWNNGMLGYARVANHYTEEFPRELRDSRHHYITHSVGKDHFGWNKTAKAGIPHGYMSTMIYDGIPESYEFDNYDNWFNQTNPDVNPMCTGLTFNDYRGAPYGLPEKDHPTAWVGRRAVSWIKNYTMYQRQVGASQANPFLLKVSFHRPHSPYDPPKDWADKIDASKMPLPWEGDWAGRFKPHAKVPNPGIWYGDLGTHQAQESRKYYYANVAFIDSWIGQIVQTLKEEGVWNNTFVVFTADHGDMLMDHYHWRKGYPYEGAAHIPYIVRWPETMTHRVSTRRGSHDDKHVVELRDIRATFLDVAGVKPVGRLDGLSLLHLLNSSATPSWRPYLELEHSTCYNETNHWNAFTDGHTKYIYNAYYTPGTCDGEYCAEQLFDLDIDPHEIQDVARRPEYQKTVEMWRSRMVDMFENQGRGPTWVKDGQLQRRTRGQLYSPNYPEFIKPHWLDEKTLWDEYQSRRQAGHADFPFDATEIEMVEWDGKVHDTCPHH